jgi:O-antigen/teichoic acid export membrane protein
MSTADTKANFFRQSGWMMTANVICGFLMMCVHPFASGMAKEEYGVFLTMLRLFTLITIPVATLQSVLAQQSAAAVNEEGLRDLSETTRGLLKWTTTVWIGLALVVVLFRGNLLQTFKASNSWTLWATLLLILGSLWMPIFQGLLQGVQNFLIFGWSLILNGFGRVSAVALVVYVLHGTASGALFGAFIGVLGATALAAWPVLPILKKSGGRFDKKEFLRRLVPLTIAAGSSLFLTNVGMPTIQSHFPESVTAYYGAAETVGISVWILCAPVTAVMFPKLVRSRAVSQSTSALMLAIFATGCVAAAGAMVCTFFPELPLRIMFAKRPEFLRSAPLIPLFMWAMVPLTLYHVLVHNLMARRRYEILPFSFILPIAYWVTIKVFVDRTHLPPFDAFGAVIRILVIYSTLLMFISIYFTRRALHEESGGDRSPPGGAKP